jgi:hypothetical protein
VASGSRVLGKKQLVPKSIWKHVQANAKLIEANLAEEREDGIYVRGSSEYLSWVAERRLAAQAGGKKSAEKRSKKPKQTPTKRKQTQPSGSISSSGSNSDSSSGCVENPPAKPSGPPEDIGLRRQVWDAYREAYITRYKSEPVRNAKVNGQVKQLAERLGSEAPDVVRFYLQHDKSFYVNKLHDIGLCVADAEALRTQWFHGRAVTQVDIKRFERASAVRDLNKMIDEGEI